MLELLPLPKPPAPEMEIREMTPEEVLELKPIFEQRGGALPDPSISSFIGVFKRGTRVAFLCLQLKLHAQPLMIEEGHSEVFKPLISEVEKFILKKCGPQWVYTFTPAGKLTQLAQAMGMQLEPWCVMSKLVVPEAPPKDVTVTFDIPEMPNPPEESPNMQDVSDPHLSIRNLSEMPIADSISAIEETNSDATIN